LGIVAMFAGSIAAIYQDNLKRLLAYSSVAQVGYMTLGMGLASVQSVTGALVHVFNHALMKGGLFLVCGCITMRIASSEIKDLRGLGRRMPFTMAAFIVGGLALIGVPATAGFVSKWYLVLAAFERGGVGLAALLLLSSLLAVVYVWRVVEVAYFQKPASEERCEAPISMLLPTWILIGASIYFGLHTDLTVGVASGAARQLLGVAP
jgi:multicomponent Na+:H+ antiporter subunit D